MFSAPVKPSRTDSKSAITGASTVAKSESGVISFFANVSSSARSKIESSSLVIAPNITRNKPLSVITALRIISSVDTCSPTGRGKSNGLTFASDASEMLINVPPTASDNCLYSNSGSITITHTPTMSKRKISSFTAYDLPAPDVANTTEFAFCSENRSNKIKLLL